MLFFGFTSIQNLNGKINADDSKHLVRKGKIIVVLKKEKEEAWSDLKKKGSSD